MTGITPRGNMPANRGYRARPSGPGLGLLCDGSDTHNLAWPACYWIRCVAIGTAALTIEIALGLPDGLEIVTGFHILLALLGLTTSARVDAGSYITVRWGRRRAVSLPDIVQVDRYSNQGGGGLRLLPPGRRRGVELRMSGIGSRVDRAAAAHLLHHLDRPEVTWGAEAWDLLARHAGAAHAAARSGLDAPAPSGTRTPTTRRRRLGRPVALVALVVAAVATSIWAPFAWGSYLGAHAFDSGPATTAQLLSGYNDAQHNLTSFTVRFQTAAGQTVTTTFRAGGIWTPLDPGASVIIRYDRATPARVVMSSDPTARDDLNTALTVTTVALCCLTQMLVIGFRFARRRGGISLHPRRRYDQPEAGWPDAGRV